MPKNPILMMDYPDPDIIRVADTYYMISTTMHFMPGGAILRSYDLVHWELVSYVFQTLDKTPAQCLAGGKNIYGKGMWAASLRYHHGRYYVCFAANDTHKTYLYQAADIHGPWQKHMVAGFYHDGSLLFDDAERVYIIYGNTDIYVTELDSGLTGPKPGGLHKRIITDRENDVRLGYEGAHAYKINGRYYVFLIHWPAGYGQRTQACFHSDSIAGEFIGLDILEDTMGFAPCGVAQGGIVDTPAGNWYSMLFQDHGAAGRMPVLVPMTWDGHTPVLGKAGKISLTVAPLQTGRQHTYAPLYSSDDFRFKPEATNGKRLQLVWQWNHTPDDALWKIDKRGLWLQTDKRCINVTQAKNTLTQRMIAPSCSASVTVDGSKMNYGDVAGICALQGNYGLVALTKEADDFYLVVITQTLDSPETKMIADDAAPGNVQSKIPLHKHKVRLQIRAGFYGTAQPDDRAEQETVSFFYNAPARWKQLASKHPLQYRLDHFTGCRFGLCYYSTQKSGGFACFSDFIYEVPTSKEEP